MGTTLRAFYRVFARFRYDFYLLNRFRLFLLFLTLWAILILGIRFLKDPIKGDWFFFVAIIQLHLVFFFPQRWRNFVFLSQILQRNYLVLSHMHSWWVIIDELYLTLKAWIYYIPLSVFTFEVFVLIGEVKADILELVLDWSIVHYN
jgi:hypothetical protein